MNSYCTWSYWYDIFRLCVKECVYRIYYGCVEFNRGRNT